MEWEQLKTEVENAVGKRLDQLQSNLETQHARLQETITKVQGFAELLKGRMPNGDIKTPDDECEGLQRAQTARTHFKSEIPPKPVTADLKKPLKKEEDKKKPEDKKDDNKTKLEEAKKKKAEEDNKKKEIQQKKKEEEDAKKKEAMMKKKEEEEAKKKEVAAKKKEEEEKKKEEAKKKTEEAKEKKKQEDLEKKAKAEEAKKKAEEEKLRKKEEDDRKKEEAKKKLEEEKQKKKEEDDKKKEEAKKKAEEEKEKKAKAEEAKKKSEEEKKKKKPEETKKKPEETKKKTEEEKKKKEDSKKPDPKLSKNISPKTEEQPKIPELSASSSENHEKEPEKPKEPTKEPTKDPEPNNKIPSFETLPQDEPPGRPSEGRITAPENMPQMSLEEIQILINNIKNNCSDEEINIDKPFELTVGAKSALSLLTTMDDEKFYFDRIPREEIIWTFRLFYVLMKLELPDNDEEAWNVCQEFLKDAKNKDKNNKTIDKFIIEKIATFDFSNENMDKLEVMLYGKDNLLQPQYYTEFCALTGLLMFAVREAAIYGGAVKGKIPIWRQYKRLLHKQQQLENALLS
ncbi:hypothetical protein SteCoe_24209 [Stentor coeruleus]|uniref:Uncharacterized protein n=1 Tax=Stentor coeruleus TaxID=5963 RepID=A0A1R2BII6_9CILI|nr:hypothetical protein SteCoe_24209 [Stentor coeruleus]